MWRTNRSQCAKISPILAGQSQNPLVSTKKSLWEWVRLALPTGNFRKDCGETDMLPSGLNIRYIVLLCSVHSSVMQRLGPYTSHSLLLRRFVFRNVEASDWWWTARDHGKGTDSRRSDVWPVVSFPPSFARTFSSRERRVGTRQYQSQVKKPQAYMMRHLRKIINIIILERQNHKQSKSREGWHTAYGWYFNSDEPEKALPCGEDGLCQASRAAVVFLASEQALQSLLAGYCIPSYAMEREIKDGLS